ncbi:MAG: acyltransferase family protein, partial [Isosphaeraceae bacterium]
MKMAGVPGATRILGNIQSLRAVAAWAVVYYHYVHHLYDLKPTSLVLKAVCFYGNFGVDLFFVISGVIMFYSVSQRQVSAREFISKRLVRIVPAYWFYSLLLFLLVICPVELLRPDVPYTWKTLAESIVFMSDDSDPGGAKAPLLYVGWTLTFEMIFYSIFAAGLVLPTRRKLLLVF